MQNKLRSKNILHYHDVNSQYVEEFSRVIRNLFISQVTILNDK